MHKVMGLSSSSRAAIKAAQEARLAPRTPSPDKLHREVFPSEHRLHTISNLDPLDPPPLEKSQEDMDIDAEVAELLSKRYTGRRPSSPEEILRRVGEDLAILTGSPSYGRRSPSNNSSGGRLSPPRPLSPAQLESVAARGETSTKKHVSRLHVGRGESPPGEPPVEMPKKKPSSPARRRRSRSPDERPAGSVLGQSTTARAIYIHERKAFGRKPITNAAPSLMYAGSPRSVSPTTSTEHLKRVTQAIPPAIAAKPIEYYDPPKPQRLSPSLKKMAPGLAAFLEEAHQEAAEIWAERSAVNLATPSRSSGMYSPAMGFHGYSHRTPHTLQFQRSLAQSGSRGALSSSRGSRGALHAIEAEAAVAW